MRANLCKVKKMVEVAGLLVVLLAFQNALAQRPGEQVYTAFHSITLGEAIRSPVYIMTNLPEKATLNIEVQAPFYKGMVAYKLAEVYPGKRTIIQMPWKAIDNKGYILPGRYDISITAIFATGQPIPITNFGVAAGYPTPSEAINAVKITAIIPDPVMNEAKIQYSLGLEAAVTMDILNGEAIAIDNVITKQQRTRGKNEETWVRCEKAKSGPHKVKVVSKDRIGIAVDFEGFAVK